MTDTNLRALHGGPGAAYPPWPEQDEKDLRETLEEALRDGEHVLVFYIHRLPDNQTKHAWCRNSRGTRTSFFEMMGAVYQLMSDWARGGDE